IEHHVDAAAARQLAGAGAEVLVAVVDGRARTERDAALALVGAADRDERVVARLAQELDRGGADASAAAVDERGLPGPDGAEPGEEEVRERGEERLRESPRLLVGERLRNGNHRALVDDRLLRIAAAREQRHHALADGEPAHVVPDLGDVTRALEAEDRG